MSRTYKDKPSKLTHEPWDKDTLRFEYEGERLDYYTNEPKTYIGYGHLDLPTTKTKKRKEVDTEEHWMSTPSWWTHLCMNKPQRRAGRIWEATVLREDIEETDAPGVSKRPHIYYW